METVKHENSRNRNAQRKGKCLSVHNPGLRFTNDPEAIESQFERIDDVIMGGRYPALIPKKNGFGLVRKEACVDLTERTPSRFVPFQVGLCFAWMLLCKLYALYLHSAGSMRKGYSILIFFGTGAASQTQIQRI